MENDNNSTYIGIVIARIEHSEIYSVWCPETYIGRHGSITANPKKPVKLGDWVTMNFHKQEANIYFPDPKDKSAPKFHTTNYSVTQEWYKTEVEGVTIRVKFEQELMANQMIINHHLFGKVCNPSNLQFPTGHYHVTIKRIRVKPNMEGDWVLDSIYPVFQQLENEEIQLTGIVMEQNHVQLNSFHVWCKEKEIGNDITITCSNIPLGTWIKMKIEKNEMSQTFLECHNYTIIPPIYETVVVGLKKKFVQLTLECFARKTDLIINHPFVGDIINNRKVFEENGKYSISVGRKFLKYVGNVRKYEWFFKYCKLIQLEHEPAVTSPVASQHQSRFDLQPQLQQMNNHENRARSKSRVRSRSRARGPSIELIGLVVEGVPLFPRQRYVWCEQRHPGNEIIVENMMHSSALKLGQWIKIAVSQQEFKEFFPKETPENGQYPSFVCREYTLVDDVHSTERTGPFLKSVCLNIIVTSENANEKLTPFLGSSNNMSAICNIPGHYKVTITWTKPFDKNSTYRFWKLDKCDRINPASSGDFAVNNQRCRGRSKSQPRESRSQLERQFSSLSLCTNIGRDEVQNRVSSRSKSRSRGILKRANPVSNTEQLISHLSTQNLNDPGHPIPKPRNFLGIANPAPNNPKIVKTALIIRIVPNNRNGKTVFGWLLEDKQECRLFLNDPEENQNLEPGTFINAPFSERDGKWAAFKDVRIIESPPYKTRHNGNGGVDIHLMVGNRNPRDPQHFNHTWLQHYQFGDIIDQNSKLQNHSDLKYHMWIRREWLGDVAQYQWMVVEQTEKP